MGSDIIPGTRLYFNSSFRIHQQRSLETKDTTLNCIKAEGSLLSFPPPLSLSLSMTWVYDSRCAWYPPGLVSNKPCDLFIYLFWKCPGVCCWGTIFSHKRSPRAGPATALAGERSARISWVERVQAFLADSITINQLRLTENSYVIIAHTIILYVWPLSLWHR